jgi:hypothetical protein
MAAIGIVFLLVVGALLLFSAYLLFAKICVVACAVTSAEIVRWRQRTLQRRLRYDAP